MSSFDEKPTFKKYVVTASLTLEQRNEFSAMKTRLGINTDGALIKKALAALSHSILGFEEILNGGESDSSDGRLEDGTDDSEAGDSGVNNEAGTVEGEAVETTDSTRPDPWSPGSTD